MSQFGLKNFLRIAKANLDPDTRTFDGLQQYATNWFCEKFNTTPNDDRLERMTLEELLVLWQQDRLAKDPTLYAKEVEDAADGADYEAWLREEMGADYVSEKENIAEMLEYEDEQKTKRKEKDEARKRQLAELPDKISTDFSKFHQDE